MRALPSFIVSTTSFGLLLLAGVAAAAEPFSWSQPVDDPIHTPAELVESMHTAFGYNHCRAVHAKGIILEGEFVPMGIETADIMSSSIRRHSDYQRKEEKMSPRLRETEEPMKSQAT